MMKRLLCALTALALCLLPVCLAQGEAKEPVWAFLLESLKEGEACPGAGLGANLETVAAAGVALETLPETMSDFGGKLSRTFQVKQDDEGLSLNGTKLREASFQFLDDALLNVSFYFLPDTQAEPFIALLDELYGEHAQRDTVLEGTAVLIWTVEANGHSVQVALIQATEGETACCSSIQATATDLLPSAGTTAT